MIDGSRHDNSGSQQSSQQHKNAANLFEQRMKRLCLAVNVDSDVNLAKALGLKKQAISSARTRKQVPSSWVQDVSDRYKVSSDWLLYGTGPMYREGGGAGEIPVGTGGGDESHPYIKDTPEGASAPKTALEAALAEAQGFKISEALSMTAEVLESGTTYAIALYLNIAHFRRAIQAESKVRELEHKVKQMEDRFTVMERRLAELEEKEARRNAQPSQDDISRDCA